MRRGNKTGDARNEVGPNNYLPQRTSKTRTRSAHQPLNGSLNTAPTPCRCLPCANVPDAVLTVSILPSKNRPPRGGRCPTRTLSDRIGPVSVGCTATTRFWVTIAAKSCWARPARRRSLRPLRSGHQGRPRHDRRPEPALQSRGVHHRSQAAARRCSGSPRSSPPTSATPKTGTRCASNWKSPC